MRHEGFTINFFKGNAYEESTLGNTRHSNMLDSK